MDSLNLICSYKNRTRFNADKDFESLPIRNLISRSGPAEVAAGGCARLVTTDRCVPNLMLDGRKVKRRYSSQTLTPYIKLEDAISPVITA